MVVRLVVSLVVLFAFIASPAAAQERRSLILPSIALIGAEALDLHSTHQALSSGAGREANPGMTAIVNRPVTAIAVKASASVFTIWLAHRLERRHPTAAKALLYTSAAAVSVIAARNYRIASSAR